MAPTFALIGFLQLVLASIMVFSFTAGSSLGYKITIPFIVILAVVQIFLSTHS
jgi:heme/copper-type cytochrome/quinol oxidase subunit 4